MFKKTSLLIALPLAALAAFIFIGYVHYFSAKPPELLAAQLPAGDECHLRNYADTEYHMIFSYFECTVGSKVVAATKEGDHWVFKDPWGDEFEVIRFFHREQSGGLEKELTDRFVPAEQKKSCAVHSIAGPAGVRVYESDFKNADIRKKAWDEAGKRALDYPVECPNQGLVRTVYVQPIGLTDFALINTGFDGPYGDVYSEKLTRIIDNDDYRRGTAEQLSIKKE